MDNYIDTLLDSMIAPKLIKFLKQTDSNLTSKQKIEQFLKNPKNQNSINEIISASVNYHNLAQATNSESGIREINPEQDRLSSTSTLQPENQDTIAVPVRSNSGMQVVSSTHQKNLHNQVSIRRYSQLNSETVNNKTKTDTQTQFSTSFSSSFVNSENVSDILSELSNSFNSENPKSMVDCLKKLTQLVKSDTGSDFFNEHIILQIGTYLDHAVEEVNQAALLCHAAILLGNLSTHFIFQAFENLCHNIHKISSQDLDKIGALKRIRLVFDFFELNFENNQRNPSLFIHDILDHFIHLICQLRIFSIFCLFKYKWFERFSLKSHLRKHILSNSLFVDKFLPMAMQIVEGKFETEPEGKNPGDRVKNLAQLNGKLKTLTYVNCLEILTQLSLYADFVAQHKFLAEFYDEKLEKILLENSSCNSKTLVNKTSISCLKLLKNVERLPRAVELGSKNLPDGNFPDTYKDFNNEDFLSYFRENLITTNFIKFYQTHHQQNYVKNIYQNVKIQDIYQKEVYIPLISQGRRDKNTVDSFYGVMIENFGFDGISSLEEFEKKFYTFVIDRLFLYL